MNNREEVLQWMQTNAARLRSCDDAMEMVELAVLCGASVTLACEVLSQGHIDILTRSTEHTRQKYYLDGSIKISDTRGGRPDLEEQWLALYNQLVWGDDFESEGLKGD